METNEIATTELEEMRQQMNLLKEKLDKETIVSDRLLRQSMSDKIGLVKGQTWITYLCCVLTIVLIIPICKELNLSWHFLAATIGLMGFSALFTWKYHRGIRPDMMNGDLKSVALRMRQLKKDYRTWKFIGYPLLALWVLLFVWELFDSQTISPEVRNSLLIGVAVGLLIGGILGIMLTKKTEHRVDEILDQIDPAE